jgi:hypothetical protein
MDPRVQSLWRARERLVAPRDCLFPLRQKIVKDANQGLPTGDLGIARTETKSGLNPEKPSSA